MSSEIKTNTISEVTSANGVSIDGVVLKDSALSTTSNKYAFIKGAENNSLGYYSKIFMGVSAELTSGGNVPSATREEIGSNSGAYRWTANCSTTVSGSNNSDPFGVFNGTTGRFTAFLGGYYYVTAQVNMADPSDQDKYIVTVVVDGDHTITFNRISSTYTFPGGSVHPTIIASGILAVNASEYISLFVQNESSSQKTVEPSLTRFHIHYVGSSAL